MQIEELIDKKLPVLDHGFIILKDFMGGDDAVVQSARVSYGAGTKTKREDDKLIDYLIKHNHVSPMESCTIKLHIKIPIFLDRQWYKHNGKKNEVSARYSVIPTEQYIPHLDQIQKQSTSNKQGRSEVDPFVPEEKQEIVDSIMRAFNASNREYEYLIDMGLSREIARIVMPVATYTEYYWTTNMRDLCFLLKSRLHSSAQYEISEYARAIAEIIMPVWAPSVWKAFQYHKLES